MSDLVLFNSILPNRYSSVFERTKVKLYLPQQKVVNLDDWFIVFCVALNSVIKFISCYKWMNISFCFIVKVIQPQSVWKTNNYNYKFQLAHYV